MLFSEQLQSIICFPKGAGPTIASVPTNLTGNLVFFISSGVHFAGVFWNSESGTSHSRLFAPSSPGPQCGLFTPSLFWFTCPQSSFLPPSHPSPWPDVRPWCDSSDYRACLLQGGVCLHPPLLLALEVPILALSLLHLACFLFPRLIVQLPLWKVCQTLRTTFCWYPNLFSL